jgi:hypothetical protein
MGKTVSGSGTMAGFHIGSVEPMDSAAGDVATTFDITICTAVALTQSAAVE